MPCGENRLSAAWLMCWFFAETKLLEYPTHHHPSSIWKLHLHPSLYARTTISGGKYIYTYAHKSALNILVTQNIMTFRHKLCSICSTNYTFTLVSKASEGALQCWVWSDRYAVSYVNVVWDYCGGWMCRERQRCRTPSPRRPQSSVGALGETLKNTGCIFLHIYAYSERRKIDRRFIIPWFLWNMHWNVNEYNKFTFNGLPGN